MLHLFRDGIRWAAMGCITAAMIGLAADAAYAACGDLYCKTGCAQVGSACSGGCSSSGTNCNTCTTCKSLTDDNANSYCGCSA